MDPVAITVTRSDPVGASSFQAALSRLSKLPLWQAMLAVLAGQVTATEACQALGMSRSGFYQRLTRVLTAIVWALTDRPAGRPRRGVPRSWPQALERLEGLRAENAHLKQELRRERLARLALEAQVIIFKRALGRAGVTLLARLGIPYLRFSGEEKRQILGYLEQALELGSTVKAFAQQVGKSYHTWLAWRARWLSQAPSQGVAALEDRDSVPESRRWHPAVIREVRKAQREHPDWGARQISLHLRNRQENRVMVSPSGVWSILKAHPVRLDRAARQARRKKLHTFGQPNLAACLDWVELKLGRWSIYLVLVMDEATRFITAWRLAFSPTTQVVLAALRDALRAYGRPLVVKTDNGTQFKEGWRETLGAWRLFALNSPLYYGPFNGKFERAIKALRRFLCFRPPPEDLERLGEFVGTWIYEHNHLVHNENLGGLTPAQAFLEGRPLQQPEHIEQVEWRREGDGLILNFTNRHGGRARRALQLAG